MKVFGLVLALTSLGALAVLEGDARACGGCFHPDETPTVVTDHRMIFSISRTQSTLYDQIKYTGSPSSFGWVLPFSGEIVVGVSSDGLFGSLDAATETEIYAPPMNCPSYPATCPPQPLPPSAKSSGARDDNSVSVLKHEVVGPYETVQLKATTPNALNDWLAKNGYKLPDDVKPVVAAYQGEHFNFLALKLVPGKGIQDMRPIRVTTKGANVALPLRMVAAGTGAKVGITLWVIGEGRYEPQNFASFTIAESDLTWDWTQNASDYVALRAQRTDAGGGKVWEIESSILLERGLLNVNRGEGDYLPVDDGQGHTMTPEQAQKEDVDTLLAGITPGTERVTRMRADLAHAALATDLLLKAGDQAVLSRERNITKERNEPMCTVYAECKAAGMAPRSAAAKQTAANANSGSSDDGCTTTKKSAPGSTWLAIGLAFAGVAAGRAIRRRRAR